MATASTYYWFYQKVRNHGPWDYKAYDPYWAAFGNFNFGAAGTAAGIPATTLLMGLDLHKNVQEHRNLNGGNGLKSPLRR
jgi:hypothetical protein